MSHHVLKEAKSYMPTAGVKEFASHTRARSMVLPNYCFAVTGSPTVFWFVMVFCDFRSVSSRSLMGFMISRR
jgi:hypothetical protein